MPSMTHDTARTAAGGDPAAEFLAARDFLLAHRGDPDAASAGFTWPRPRSFNWAQDWFDRLAAGNTADALRIAEEDGTVHALTFEELAAASRSAATWLRAQGVAAGDRVLVMLGNQRELWEVMLAAMRLRAVVIPATPLLGTADLRDRIERGRVRHVIVRAEDTGKFDTAPGTYTRIAAGPEAPSGWRRLADMYGAEPDFTPDGETSADDPLMLYFTSGTTARPKLVEHTHASYPIGHLSTMYWIGLRPGDVHLNIASPGWAKHAWSNLFAPWNAGATVFVHNYARFDAERLMELMDRHGVTTFCAPPTVWRMLIQSDLSTLRTPPREAVAAGEPLNPEVIEKVRDAWGVTVRDGFGQTETTLQIGNFPGVPVKPGSMGRPAPGYRIVLLDPVTGKESQDEGEICVDLGTRPAGVMTGYRDDPERTAESMADGLYRTGDIAARDADGYLSYVGRSDDVFKASDYKISPFELESALLEHEAVAEAAVVPAPDPVRLAVPKAYVALAAGWEAGPETARALFAHSRAVLSPYKRIRRIEFAELPKTVSGKIRRVELRALTAAGSGTEYDEAELG
ncbi:AMP-dependent synthetase [Streptomyces globosus]|uniref:AMP-dependent synthetase n=2 Tax=Streptomyces TaxID=1883 RepID=A0A344TYF5_9ACTN|nr:AMP-dependent synthetase [Streptomyces globosus]